MQGREKAIEVRAKHAWVGVKRRVKQAKHLACLASCFSLAIISLAILSARSTIKYNYKKTEGCEKSMALERTADRCTWIIRYHNKLCLTQVQAVFYGCFKILAGSLEVSEIHLIVAYASSGAKKDEWVIECNLLVEIYLTCGKVLEIESLFEIMAYYKPVAVYLFFIDF